MGVEFAKQNCTNCRHGSVLAGREPCATCLRKFPSYSLWQPVVAGAAVADPPRDGWIEWGGGDCPVPPTTLVKVKLRNGSVRAGPSYASAYRWEHLGGKDPYDIVEYSAAPELEQRPGTLARPEDQRVFFPVPAPAVSESAKRKGMPLFSGCLAYFPDALLAVAEHSRKANDKHNPGEPLHWSKDKSKDHADCVARHLTDIGPNWDATDPEFGSYHATALAWRALALLQTVIEKKRAEAPKPLAIDSAALR